jgi:hypothetical protein
MNDVRPSEDSSHSSTSTSTDASTSEDENDANEQAQPAEGNTMEIGANEQVQPAEGNIMEIGGTEGSETVHAERAGDDTIEPFATKRRQFLGTWSHTDLPSLKKPCDLSKEEFGNLLLTCAAKSFAMPRQGHQVGTVTNRILKACVVDELQQNGEVHKHFPILADKPFTSGPLEKVLREEGIAVHFSDTHSYYWTTFVYVTVPGSGPDKKKLEDLDPNPWLSPGHPPKEDELMQIPPGAYRSDKLRVRSFLGLDARGNKKNDQKEFMSDHSFASLLIQHSLKTRRALYAWIERGKKAGSEEAKMASAYVEKQHKEVNARISLAWEMHTAVADEEMAALTPWEIVMRAKTTTCVCAGKWVGVTEEMLALQVTAGERVGMPADELPHSAALRDAFRRSLQEGCEKHNNVYIYGPKDAAKSHMLQPLLAIFGVKNSFRRPIGRSNFPMMSIHGKKVCLLEDMRVNTFKIGFDALLVWFEGQPVEVPMPQNQHDGNKDYTDRAPIFATSGAKLRIPLQEALETKVDPEEQNKMMDSRWRYFCHTHSFKKQDKVRVEACPHCFAKWVDPEDCVVVDFF